LILEDIRHCLDFDGTTVAADWIRDLESSDSRLHKERVIEKAVMASQLGSASAQCFLFNCYLALNPFYVYNVKKVPESQGITGAENPWTQFWALLESLRTRSVTGGRAREAIEAMMQRFDSEEWNGLARRVMIKDLRCGVSEKTINKVCGHTDWAIPTFSCQLAKDSSDRAQDMRGAKRLEAKLDGVRVIAILSGAGVYLYSRSGRVFENFPDIEREIFENQRWICDTLGQRNLVLDGEIVGESFQQLMKQAHRKSDVQTGGMRYHVFDWIPLEDFEQGSWDRKQHLRLEALSRLSTHLQERTQNLRIMPGMTVDLDTESGRDAMQQFAQDSVGQGFEGILIKDINAPYECKRTTAWLKYKPVHDYDLTVVAVEEGTGKNKGKMGALVCEGRDQDKFIQVNVGSGFSDEQRRDYWDNRARVIGQTAVILCDAITQNQDGAYSLRFPRFKTFRDDK